MVAEVVRGMIYWIREATTEATTVVAQGTSSPWLIPLLGSGTIAVVGLIGVVIAST